MPREGSVSVPTDGVSAPLYNGWAEAVAVPVAASVTTPLRNFEPIRTNQGSAYRPTIGTQADDNIVAIVATPKLATAGIQLPVPLATGVATPLGNFEPIRTNQDSTDRPTIGTEADDNIVAMAAMPKLATASIQLPGSEQFQGEKVADLSTPRQVVSEEDAGGSRGAPSSVAPVHADGPSQSSSAAPLDRPELTTTNLMSAPDETPVPTASPIQSIAAHPGANQRQDSNLEPLSGTNLLKNDGADASLMATKPAGLPAAQPGSAPVEAPPAADSRSMAPTQGRTVRVADTTQRSEMGIHLVPQHNGLNISGTILGSGQAGMSDPAGARVAQGPGGESIGASTSHSGPLPGEAFAALDGEVAQSAPTWIHAGAQRAEAGYQDPALGWVSVRADANGGGIHAALVPSSADAAQTLGGQMAGLNTYLTEHHAPLATLTIATPENRDGMSGMDSSGNGSMHQQSGQAGDQAMRQGSGQEGSDDLRVARAETNAPVLPAVSILTDRSATQSTATASGHHISVVA